MHSKYGLKKLIVNGVTHRSGELPIPLPEFVHVELLAHEQIIKISTYSDEMHGYCDIPKVRVIYDPTARQFPTSTDIGLACLGLITNADKGDNLLVGPIIVRGKNVSSFPEKLSFPGGTYDYADCSPKMAVIREICEELDLKSYMPCWMIDLMLQKCKLSHMVVTPGVEHFNILLIYTIEISKVDQYMFNPQYYQKEEVESVFFMDGTQLIESLMASSPYEKHYGWTPVTAAVICDVLGVTPKSLTRTDIESAIDEIADRYDL